jgi:hypothetical protein
MIDFSVSHQQFIDAFKERLARVQNGEVWGSDHPGPYSDEESCREVDRIKALIRSVEEETATSPIVSPTGVAATGAVGICQSASIHRTLPAFCEQKNDTLHEGLRVQ